MDLSLMGGKSTFSLKKSKSCSHFFINCIKEGDLDALILFFTVHQDVDLNNIRISKDDSLLHYLAGKHITNPPETYECLRILVEEGLDIFMQDANGDTPMIVAMKFSNMQMIEILLDLSLL